MRVRRDPSWYQSDGVLGKFSRSRPAATRIRDIHEDEDGLLWVLVMVPDERWAESLVSSPEGDRIVDRNASYDTVVEVLDPGRGLLLASTRYDQYLTQFLEDGRVASYLEEGSDDAPAQILIWRPMVVGDGKNGNLNQRRVR